MSLEAALENANASIRDLVESLGSDERADIASIPLGALGWAIAKAATARPERRFVLVTAASSRSSPSSNPGACSSSRHRRFCVACPLSST
jgi:hypothetical protein